MKSLGKVLIFSLLGCFFLGLMFAATSGGLGTQEILVSAGLTAFVVGLIEIVVGIIMLFTKSRPLGLSILNSGVILLVIGFSSCLGGFTG